jgi:hypothetical protein
LFAQILLPKKGKVFWVFWYRLQQAGEGRTIFLTVMVLLLIYKAIKWTKGTDLTQYSQPKMTKMTEKTQARRHTRVDSIP